MGRGFWRWIREKIVLKSGREEEEEEEERNEAEMDKSMLGDLDSLPEEDTLRMSAMIDQLQIRDSLRMYNSLVERCFSDCVETFRRKSLDKQEESCVR